MTVRFCTLMLHAVLGGITVQYVHGFSLCWKCRQSMSHLFYLCTTLPIFSHFDCLCLVSICPALSTVLILACTLCWSCVPCLQPIFSVSVSLFNSCLITVLWMMLCPMCCPTAVIKASTHGAALHATCHCTMYPPRELLHSILHAMLREWDQVQLQQNCNQMSHRGATSCNIVFNIVMWQTKIGLNQRLYAILCSFWNMMAKYCVWCCSVCPYSTTENQLHAISCTMLHRVSWPLLW